MDNKIYKNANKNSPIMQYTIKILKEAIVDIRNGECNEQELTDALAQFNPENKGYVKEDDFMNYDEVGQELGLRWNRNRINELCKKHKIQNKRFNNMHIGFPRKEILRLKGILLLEEK